MRMIFLVFLFLSNTLSASYPHDSLIGHWRSKEVKQDLIFNADHTCDIVVEKNHIVGTWGVYETLQYLVVLDGNGKAYIFKIYIADDGPFENGEFIKRLALYFCGDYWMYDYESYRQHEVHCVEYRLVK